MDLVCCKTCSHHDTYVALLVTGAELSGTLNSAVPVTWENAGNVDEFCPVRSGGVCELGYRGLNFRAKARFPVCLSG